MSIHCDHSKPALQCRVADGVYYITLSNPQRRNAMTLQMWRDFSQRVREAEDDAQVRVIAVRGQGTQAFSSGADISEFGVLRVTPQQVADYGLAVDQMQHALTQCHKPTVALIQGICMGGGMEIAAACDIRYATPSARFRMPAGVMGIAYPLIGVARMVDIVGASRAADIFMTSRTFDGTEAGRIGFAQEIFSEEQFDELVSARVAAIANSAPLSMKASKLMLRHLSNQDQRPDLKSIQQAHDACFSSADYHEAQQAFKEKRPPVFRGH